MLQIKLCDNQVIFTGELNCDTLVSYWPFKLLAQLPAEATFDLAGLVHVDTAGLAWLLHQVAAAKQQKLTLQMIRVPAQLLRLAEVSDVVALLPISASD